MEGKVLVSRSVSLMSVNLRRMVLIVGSGLLGRLVGEKVFEVKSWRGEMLFDDRLLFVLFVRIRLRRIIVLIVWIRSCWIIWVISFLIEFDDFFDDFYYWMVRRRNYCLVVIFEVDFDDEKEYNIKSIEVGIFVIFFMLIYLIYVV